MTNQRLLELYKSHESVIYEISSRCSEDMEGPFLIAPDEAYWSARTKVVFVGQETNGWSSQDDISSQMATYTRFDLGKSYYSSPFWNVIRKFESALTGSNFSSAWLNFNRYDQEGGRPSWDNQCILSELDFLFLEELKLLTPDIVIFFTGPNYDERIAALMEATYLPVKNFPIRQLGEIKASEFKTIMFRTYHPNYLRRSGLEEKVIEEICTEVATRMQGN
ncbi:MAG: hypothetical protein ACYDHC_05175 [Desulfuromonadaceae bacterium]